MIKAEIFVDKSGCLCGFRVIGHANYAEEGSDIVCSAVSSASYMAANTVTEIIHAQTEVICDEGYMQIRVLPKDVRLCQDILSGFKLHLSSLEEQYSNYMTVNYLEV